VSSLEGVLLPELRTLSEPTVLLNSGGRVIGSSSSDLASGMRLPLPDSPARAGSPPMDWQLLDSLR
jgi:hypothetical protein